MPKKRFIVTLSRVERKQLEETVSKGKGAVSRIKRANILLAADENGSNMKDEDIAKAFRCHSNTSRYHRYRSTRYADGSYNRGYAPPTAPQ